MYDWLSRHLPRPIATLIVATWYALLVWAIFFALGAPDASFRYWQI